MKSSTRRSLVALFLFCSIVFGVIIGATTTHAQLLSGSIVNFPESSPTLYSFGDGTHSVSLYWSVNIFDRSGFFLRNGQTDIALATGVSSLPQITDASAFSFTTPDVYRLGPIFDAAFTGGLNSFLILKNRDDNFYGVVRLDNIFAYGTPLILDGHNSYSGLNATWWFQSNGGSDFSVVPEPATTTLLGLGVTLWLFWRRP